MGQKVTRRKLRNYLINKDVQLKIAIANLLYLLFVVFIVISSILAPFFSDIFKPNDLCVQHLSAKFFIILLERLSVALAIILITAFVHQIIITHKFCGPMVNFSKTFKKISQGDLTRKIYLRRNDLLKNEASQVNKMISNLSVQIAELKKDNGLLLSSLNGVLNKEMEEGKIDEALKIAKEQAALNNEHLQKFKILDEFIQ